MGATQYAAIPWPEPTAPVRQGAAAMRALAEAIDPRWSGAALHRTATGMITNNTITLLTWSAAINNPPVGGSSVDASQGVRIGQAGVYEIHVTGHWDANATGTRTLQVTVNGAAVVNDVGDIRPSAGAGVRTINDVTRIMRLNAGDYVNAQATQTSGVSLGLLWGRLEVYRIA